MNTYSSQNIRTRHGQLLLQTFDVLRLPLAIMVVFIHLVPRTTPICLVDSTLLSAEGVYNLLAVIFSKVLSLAAVPTFFLISGYLFFLTMQQWSWQNYANKFKRRIRTLVIPYLLWNSIGYAFLIAVVVTYRMWSHQPLDDIENLYLTGWWRIYLNFYTWDTDLINWLGNHLYLTGPYDTPLWFIRDLFVMSLISPVIYAFVKYLKEWGMCLLFLAYISKIWILTPGFNITAVFFFSLGAYIALHRVDVIAIVHCYKYILLALTAVTLALSIYYNGTYTNLEITISSLYCVFSTFTTILLASTLIVRHHVHANKLFVSACFFIYAMHYIGDKYSPINISNHILHAAIPGNSDAEYIVCYMLTPFLAAALIIAVYHLVRRYLPKVAYILTGKH